MKIKILFAACIITLFSGKNSSAADSSSGHKLEIAAGQSQIKTMIAKIRIPFEKETGIHLVINGEDGIPGPVMIKLLDTGKINAAFLTADWDSLLRVVEEQGYKISAPDQLNKTEIGRDQTFFITHPSNVKELSEENLRKILNGEISNWKAVGGKDLPVIVTTSNKSAAANKFVAEKLLNGAPFKKGIRFFQSYSEVANFVASNPGAIGIGAPEIMSPNVQHIKHPPVERVKYFVTKGPPTPDAQKLLDYVKQWEKTAGAD